MKADPGTGTSSRCTVEHIEARRFDGWSMAFGNPSDADVQSDPGFSTFLERRSACPKELAGSPADWLLRSFTRPQDLACGVGRARVAGADGRLSSSSRTQATMRSRASSATGGRASAHGPRPDANRAPSGRRTSRRPWSRPAGRTAPRPRSRPRPPGPLASSSPTCMTRLHRTTSNRVARRSSSSQSEASVAPNAHVTRGPERDLGSGLLDRQPELGGGSGGHQPHRRVDPPDRHGE